MTLLDVVNQICDLTALDRFESVCGSNDPNAQTMVALVQEAGDEIARRADWRALLKQSTIFATPAIVPADFQRLVPGGAVRLADGGFARPLTSPAQWRAASSSSQAYYVLTGNQLHLSPAAAAANASVSYVSRNWVIGDPYAERSTLQADDDHSVFPERLLVKGGLWRWKRQKGLSYEDNLAEFEADLAAEINADRGGA